MGIPNNPPAVIGVAGRPPLLCAARLLHSPFVPLPQSSPPGRPGGTRRPDWPARAGRARPAGQAGRPSRPGSSVITLEPKRGSLGTDGANLVGLSIGFREKWKFQSLL